MDKRIKTECIDNKENIVITLGDPGGVGPEIVFKSIDEEIFNRVNIIIVGTKNIVEKAVELVDFKLPLNFIKNINNIKPFCVNILSIDIPNKKFTFNQTSKENGYAAFQFILKGIELVLKKYAKAIVTAPISKEGLKLAGINFPGHTEILATYSNTKKYRMMFINDKFKLILHTIHIPLKEIFKNIKRELLIETVEIGVNFLKNRFGIKNPLIYISGLNPHAGENGIIGDEEIKEIIPAVNILKNKGILIEGPFPPDTIFFKANIDKPSLIVSLYHDQGLAPLKTLDFYGLVNITAGLPFIRTSPDHGTGFDIAWKNIANPQSMKNALKLAMELKSS